MIVVKVLLLLGLGMVKGWDIAKVCKGGDGLGLLVRIEVRVVVVA